MNLDIIQFITELKNSPEMRDDLFKQALSSQFDSSTQLSSAHYAYFSIFISNLNQQIKIQLKSAQNQQKITIQKEEDKVEQYLQQILNSQMQKISKQTQQIIINNIPIKVSKSLDKAQILDPPEASILQFLHQLQCSALQEQQNLTNIENQFDQLINRLINKLNGIDEQLEQKKDSGNELQKQYDFYHIALFRVLSTLYSLHVYSNKLKPAFGVLQLLGQIAHTQNQEYFVKNQYFKLQLQSGICQQQNLTTPTSIVNDVSELQNSQTPQFANENIGQEGQSPSIFQHPDEKVQQLHDPLIQNHDNAKLDNASFTHESDAYIYQKLINDGLISLYNEGPYNAYKVYGSLEQRAIEKSGNKDLMDLTPDARNFLSAVHINKRVLSVFAGNCSEIFYPDAVLQQRPGLIAVSAHKFHTETFAHLKYRLDAQAFQNSMLLNRPDSSVYGSKNSMQHYQQHQQHTQQQGYHGMQIIQWQPNQYNDQFQQQEVYECVNVAIDDNKQEDINKSAQCLALLMQVFSVSPSTILELPQQLDLCNVDEAANNQGQHQRYGSETNSVSYSQQSGPLDNSNIPCPWTHPQYKDYKQKSIQQSEGIFTTIYVLPLDEQ